MRLTHCSVSWTDVGLLYRNDFPKMITQFCSKTAKRYYEMVKWKADYSLTFAILGQNEDLMAYKICIFHYKTKKYDLHVINAIVLVTEHVVSLKFAFKTPQSGLFVNLLITLALYWKHTEASFHCSKDEWRLGCTCSCLYIASGCNQAASRIHFASEHTVPQDQVSCLHSRPTCVWLSSNVIRMCVNFIHISGALMQHRNMKEERKLRVSIFTTFW